MQIGIRGHKSGGKNQERLCFLDSYVILLSDANQAMQVYEVIIF